jgi:hypothetical protein
MKKILAAITLSLMMVCMIATPTFAGPKQKLESQKVFLYKCDLSGNLTSEKVGSVLFEYDNINNVLNTTITVRNLLSNTSCDVGLWLEGPGWDNWAHTTTVLAGNNGSIKVILDSYLPEYGDYYLSVRVRQMNWGESGYWGVAWTQTILMTRSIP